MAKKLPRAKPTHFNMERFFQALGDATRLRLLNLMGDQELCVCYFVEILKQAHRTMDRIEGLKAPAIAAIHGSIPTLNTSRIWLPRPRTPAA